MYWIGISSTAGQGSGKSTCGVYLQQALTHLGVTAVIVPFAKRIKDIVRIYTHDPLAIKSLHELFLEEGFPYDTSWLAAMNMSVAMTKDKTPEGEKPRRLYQLIGHEYGRQLLGPDVWIHFALKTAYAEYSAMKTDNPFVVISDDLRYDNEAEFVKLHIGLVGVPLAEDDHISEHALMHKPHLHLPARTFTYADVCELVISEIMPRIRDHHGAQ